MIFRFLNNGSSGDPIEVQQLDAIHDALHRVGSGSTEHEVFPLRKIPIEMEDAPIHDGIHPCGEPGCPCENGYGVTSLYSPNEP